jgi:hypothetical protein
MDAGGELQCLQAPLSCGCVAAEEIKAFVSRPVEEVESFHRKCRKDE